MEMLSLTRVEDGVLILTVLIYLWNTNTDTSQGLFTACQWLSFLLRQSRHFVWHTMDLGGNRYLKDKRKTKKTNKSSYLPHHILLNLLDNQWIHTYSKWSGQSHESKQQQHSLHHHAECQASKRGCFGLNMLDKIWPLSLLSLYRLQNSNWRTLTQQCYWLVNWFIKCLCMCIRLQRHAPISFLFIFSTLPASVIWPTI